MEQMTSELKVHWCTSHTTLRKGLVYGGSLNSTEALFTPDSYRDTLPLFTKPLAYLGNRSPIMDYAMKIAIVRLFSVQSFGVLLLRGRCPVNTFRLCTTTPQLASPSILQQQWHPRLL